MSSSADAGVISNPAHSGQATAAGSTVAATIRT